MTTDADNAHCNPGARQPGTTSDAEQAAGEPLPGRAMMPVSLLAAHPGNVRRDLDLNEEFTESIAANGVLTALRITPDGDSFRVIDGGRRLAAALKTGISDVPYDLVAERAGDEGGQYLDMITANRHHNPLTVLEEADALFAAHKAGAGKVRLRKAAGMTPAAVNHALTAARLNEETRAKVGQLEEQLTLDQYAILVEFEDDPTAVDRLASAARWGMTLEHEAERLRQERAEHAEHQRLRGELDNAGYVITGTLPADGQLLSSLCQDEEVLTIDTHAACPGRGVFFRPYDLASPVHYCADPARYGHTSRYAATASAPAGAAAPDPNEAPPADPPDPSRRIVIEGNKAWAAAGEVRRRWLAGLFARRTAPREVTVFITGQLLTMPEPLRSGLARAHSDSLFAQLTGRDDREWLEACQTAPAGLLPLIMLAPIATAYEYAMSEGEGRNTWRTYRYSLCPRQQAGDYLHLLAGLGYTLSVIEQAVAEQSPYTGETPPGDPIIGEPGEQEARPADDERPGDEPGTGDGAGIDPVDGTGAEADSGEEPAAA